MTDLSGRTIRLPDDIYLTLLRLRGPLTVATLRAMMAADWYLLLGWTSDPSGTSTGYGAYVGTSDALSAQTIRVGVSLRRWVFKLGQLTPDVVLLARRAGRPVGEQPRLLVEAAIARAISAGGYTVLNLRTAAPTAAKRATRQQRLWAYEVADRIANVVHGRVLAAYPPAAAGGSTREQLIRLILSQQPARAMDVNELLAAARDAGITIAGKTPQQRTRRDVTTRELKSGRPRVHRTWINRRTIVYPAGMTRRAAVANYLASRPKIAGSAQPRRPANRRPARRPQRRAA